jgi:hypothetical protein
MKSNQRKAMFSKFKQLKTQQRIVGSEYDKLHKDYEQEHKIREQIRDTQEKIDQDKKAIFSLKHPHIVAAERNAKENARKAWEWEKKQAPEQKKRAQGIFKWAQKALKKV